MQYTKIVIKYCSSDFSEILGITEDGRNVAAFVCTNAFMNTYPTQSNHLYLTKDCIFDVKHTDYNIIPYMKYGSIALLLNDMFPDNDFDLVCSKAVMKLFMSIINYSPSQRTSHHKHKVIINKDTIVIDNAKYNLQDSSILDIIPRNMISAAIKQTDQCNVILEELSQAIHTFHENKNEVFFKIIKM